MFIVEKVTSGDSSLPLGAARSLWFCCDGKRFKDFEIKSLRTLVSLGINGPIGATM